MEKNIELNYLEFLLNGSFRIKSFYSLQRPDDSYFTTKWKITHKNVKEHLLGEKIISLPTHLRQSIYIIDIDKRNQLKNINIINVLDNLYNILGEPFYLEKSEKSGGYHLYYYFNKFVNTLTWINFIKLFKKNYKGVIEIIYGNKYIKLPYSKYYKIAGKYDKNNFNRIAMTNNVEELFNIFKNKKPIERPKIFNNCYTPAYLTANKKRVFSKIVKDKSFFYGRGTRNEVQLKIATYTIRRQENFENFVNYCYIYNDGSSKDMLQSDRKIKSMLKKIWDYALKNFDGKYYEKNISYNTYDPQEFIDKDPYIFKKTEKLRLERKLKKCYRKEKNKKRKTYMEEKVIPHYLEIVRVLLTIKKFRDNNKYEYKNRYTFLNEGVPFGRDLQKMIAKKYEIGNILNKINFLEKINLLIPIKSPEGYYHSYKGKRFVKHYKVNSEWSLSK